MHLHEKYSAEMCLVFVEFEVALHDHNFRVRHSADIAQLILSHIYAFLCLHFDRMLIICNIFVELEHLIPFNNVDKYNFIYYRIIIKLMVHWQFMPRCSHAASTP